MNLNKTQLIIAGSIGLVIIIVVLVLSGVIPGLNTSNDATKIQANLKFWGVFDTRAAYDTAIASFKIKYPNVSVEYRGFDSVTDYEPALLNALATGKGPDVFMIRNNSLPRNMGKMYPLPTTMISLVQLRNLFPQIVEKDLSANGSIYALPMYIDSLALIYNTDLFNGAAISGPPKTWEDLQAIIPRLTKSESGKLVRAAAAIGGSQKSIGSAPDLLSFLMLQTGTKMVSDDLRAATFASDEGLNSLNFYTQFSNPRSNVYTWNDDSFSSLRDFSGEKVAMIFDYQSVIPKLKILNPFLSFSVSDIPQPQGAQKQISYPNYWATGVSRQSKVLNLAADFVVSLAGDVNNAESYLKITRRPPALRQLINKYLNDLDLNVFAKQSLIVKSWPQIDNAATDKVFSDMIVSVLSGQDALRVLKEAQELVSGFMQRRL
ncbi:MAG: extracellular solute-binding protein [Patescibacteria group bacterium]